MCSLKRKLSEAPVSDHPLVDKGFFHQKTWNEFLSARCKKKSTREFGDWKILLPRDILETGAVVVLHLQHLLWDALVHVTENFSQRASNEGRLSGRFQWHCVARGRHYCCHRLRQFRNLHGLRCEQDLATSSVGGGFHPRRLPWH